MRSKDAKYFRFLAVLLCLLGAVQGLMQNYDVRRLLNESLRLEGQPLARAVAGLNEPANTWIPWPPPNAEESSEKKGVFQFHLRFLSGSDDSVWVLINGKPSKRITREDGCFAARGGDLIEVAVEAGESSLVLSFAEKNVISPKVGALIKGKGILLLGKVRLASNSKTEPGGN